MSLYKQRQCLFFYAFGRITSNVISPASEQDAVIVPPCSSVIFLRLRDPVHENLVLPAEQLGAVVKEIMAGFQEYAAENGMTDPNEFNTYFAAYMQTPEAQKKLEDSGALILQMIGEMEVTPEQLEAIANDMLLGYRQYAEANSLPDPSKMGEQFMTYLQTPEAQQQLSQGIAEIVNVEELEQLISAALAEAKQGVMSSLGKMQNQVSAAMQQIMTQLAGQIQNNIAQAMSQFGTNMESALNISPEAFTDAIQTNMDGDELKELMMSLMSSENTSYESNMKTLGYADSDKPSQIDIYPKDF